MVLAFLLSPETASYQFVLLVVPVVLIMRPELSRKTILLILFLVLVGLPFGPAFRWLFPKLWLMLLLYVVVGRTYWQQLTTREVVFGSLAVVSLSLLLASRQVSAFNQERLQQGLVTAKVEPGAIYSSNPAISSGDLVYQSIGRERYVLRRAGQGSIETFAFEGHAFHPATFDTQAIFFELVSKGHSSICRYLMNERRLETVVEAQLGPIDPAMSADGSALAFVAHSMLYLQRGAARSLVATCPSLSHPAFFPDNDRIAYASGINGNSQIFIAGYPAGGIKQVTTGSGDYLRPAVSPDGTAIAFSSTETGSRQVWVQELATGVRRRLTGGNCTNDSPAWQGSREIIFTTDCGRGYGLPALYKTVF